MLTTRQPETRGRAQFIVRKALGSLLTLAFVLVFNFFLFRVVQDDPIGSLFRGRNVPAQTVENLRIAFGLDQPLLTQFFYYIRETFQLNFGISYQSRQPVWSEITAAVPATVALVGVSAVLSAVIGTVGGVIAAWRRNTWKDHTITSGTMVFYSMPDFWLGMLLLVFFAVVLGWFPVGGITDAGTTETGLALLLDRLHHMFLPAATLTLAYLGEYALVTRSSLLDVMGEDYLTVARAKGLRDAVVRRKHAVPNALLPVVTLTAINLGFVLSGAIAVEAVFSWPGLGKATADAIRGPDLPMLQGLFLVFSAAVIVFNLLADLAYAWLDPRVEGA
ncbi:MAG: ABC transporter permease [Acidimicrobiia bacterium]|nr:ABC transporter permease [Acidimicrobiia bacterium]MDH3462565.1 ABC transporter permease [Acidimicrobiia bacterium]